MNIIIISISIISNSNIMSIIITTLLYEDGMI